MVRAIRRRLAERSDEGVTLVELLVYSVLLVGMMTLVGTILINTMWTNHHILRLNEASNHSQSQLEAIALAVRNASDVEVRDSGNLLLVKRRSTLESTVPTAGVCSGWYFNPATGNLHAAHDPATDSPTGRTAAAATSPSAASNWPVMIEGVAALDGPQVFTQTSDGVQIGMAVDTSRDRKSVEFQTEATIRAKSTLPGACW